jgi:aerobic carbon-monoxide dehydrogenase medium subunit
MKAPNFLYRRPDTLDEALILLSDHRGDAQVLAGGQSLIPTLNMRLSSPAMLVDINRIATLRGMIDIGSAIRIGALVRHCEVLESPVVAAQVPLLASAMTHVAHMAVRNRGTTCGSLALADPSAEAPAVAVLLDATIHLQSKTRARDMPARDFFQGLYTTDRRDDEMITGVSFPCAQRGDVFRFSELSRRRGDFAVVGIALKARKGKDTISGMEAVIFGSEPTPLLPGVTRDMTITPHCSDGTLQGMARAIADAMDPIDNHQGRPDTKRRQAAELLRRVFIDLRGSLHDA